MPDPESPRLISVITAVDPERAEHLPEAYASLIAQDFPTTIELEFTTTRVLDGQEVLVRHPRVQHWDVEWLVQCDSLDPGAQEAVRSLLPDDDRISFGASRQGGPGIARTMALARASGELIKVLDADDQLVPGVLVRDVTACSTPDVGWSGSRVVDSHPDGVLTDHRDDVPADGRVRFLS